MSTPAPINFKKLLFGVLFSFATAVYSANISIDMSPSSDGKVRPKILIRGEITSGDTLKFITLLNNSDEYLGVVQLDSLGGNVSESIGLAEVVRELRFQTQVLNGAVCASACFFIWLEGSRRLAGTSRVSFFGMLGLHRPYLTSITNDPDSISRQNMVAANVRRHLESRHVSRRLSDLMMSRASNEIYWLTFDDLDQDLKVVNPDLEELYISKCGNSSNKLMSLRYSPTSGLTKSDLQVLDKKIDDLSNCMGDLDISASKAGRKRLVEGWRPTSLQVSVQPNRSSAEQEIDIAHPGWMKLVQSREFNTWLAKQNAATKLLAKSELPSEAIRLISMFKKTNGL